MTIEIGPDSKIGPSELPSTMNSAETRCGRRGLLRNSTVRTLTRPTTFDSFFRPLCYGH